MHDDSRSHTQFADAGALSLAHGLLVYAPIIFAGNLVGVLLRYPAQGSAILFPAYAALTAVLMAAPRRDWIWYILVSVLGHFVASIGHWPLSWVLVADVANTARALIAASLLLRLLGRQPRLDSVSSLLIFVGTSAIVAPAVGATIGASNVLLHDTTATYFGTWNAWFVSNALTALTMLPFLLGVIRSPAALRKVRLDRRRVGEAAVFGLALLITCALVFHSLREGEYNLIALYAPIPLLLWAGLRFGPTGVGLGLSIITAAAIVGADRRLDGLTTDGVVLRLQAFVFLTAMPILCVAVVATARQDAVQLYRALLASLHDQVAILDANGMVIRVNDSWQRHADMPSPCPFERSRPGENFLDACRRAVASLAILHPEDRDPGAGRVLSGAIQVLSGEARRFETDYEREYDGHPEWFIIRIEALERADGGAVVTRADISARRRAQIEIEEQRRQLSHLARVAVLGQLSGALSHELRQPLSAILANAEAARHLLEREVLDVEELRAIIHDIVADDRRAAHVIDGLRALLRRGETRLQPIAPADLVRETLVLAHAELITRRVTVTGVVEPSLPLVLADRVQIQQVLLNLVLNASESMDGTAVSERVLFLGASSAESNVCFSVRDCGAGIHGDLIERLFEPFVTTKPQGLGLGLSIARSIIAAHGGRIWAENGDVSGATVQFLLPSLPSSDEALIPPDGGYPEPSRAEVYS